MLRLSKYMKRLAHTSDQLCPLTDDDLKRLQNHLLGMFLDIARVCDKHGIRVMMCSGSALGAVRHGGFIPWDDDLDVMMLREDYDRFLAIAPAELAGRYEIMAPGLPGETKALFAKVVDTHTVFSELSDLRAPYPQGVFIDIFPLEYLPANPVVRSVKHFIANGLVGITRFTAMYRFRNPEFRRYMSGTRALRWHYRVRLGLGWCFSFLSHRTWCRIFDRFVRSAPSTRVHYPGVSYKWKGFPLAAILPVGTASFDGHRVPVPHDPHTYLTCVYGDYMKIPPVEQRERHYVVEFRLPE